MCAAGTMICIRDLQGEGTNGDEKSKKVGLLNFRWVWRSPKMKPNI